MSTFVDHLRGFSDSQRQLADQWFCLRVAGEQSICTLLGSDKTDNDLKTEVRVCAAIIVAI